MNPTKLLFAALFQLGLFSFAMGQTVNITGTITDENSKKVPGATVRLKTRALTTTTDSAGNYAIIVSSAAGIQASPAGAMPFFSGNFLTFTVARNNDKVTIETFDCRGRCVWAVRGSAMSAGMYKTIPFPAGFSSQVYFCRVTIGNTVSRLMKSPLIAASGRTVSGVQKASFAKKAASLDTLIISRSGYITKKKGVDSYTGTYSDTLKVSLTLALDWDYYQGIQDPMIITAKDPYATAATVDAIITSFAYPAPDTVKLAKVTGNPGAYSASIYFTVKSTSKAKDSVRVKDSDSITVSYHGAAPLTTTASAKAIWMAVAPSIRPNVSIYLGVKLPINIVAEDRNITDTAITIHLASQKDTVGFNVVLPALAGSFGTFVGNVYPSLTTSTPGRVIAVRPPVDTLKTIYQSQALNAPIISSALQGTALLWQCNQVSILPDSLGTGYHGTTVKMKLSLENDHVIASSLNVKVKSKKDPAGISVPMAVSADTVYMFYGSVGFTVGASNAGTGTISVAGSDTVTISYTDPVFTPPVIDSVKATWNP
jgi:hypothetical protein